MTYGLILFKTHTHKHKHKHKHEHKQTHTRTHTNTQTNTPFTKPATPPSTTISHKWHTPPFHYSLQYRSATDHKHSTATLWHFIQRDQTPSQLFPHQPFISPTKHQNHKDTLEHSKFSTQRNNTNIHIPTTKSTTSTNPLHVKPTPPSNSLPN